MGVPDRRVIAAAVALWVMAGCSSSNDGGSSTHDGDAAPHSPVGIGDAALPGIDPAARMPTLDTSQLGEICDWMYSRLGGYGTTVHCTGVGEETYQNTPDRMACLPEVTFLSTCPLTVSEFEACVLARVPSEGCASPAPECTLTLECPLDHSR